MKKVIFYTLTACLAITLFSCKSKPEAENEVLEAPAVEQTEPETEESDKKPDFELQERDLSTKEATVEVEIVTKEVDNSEILTKITSARESAVNAGAETYAKEQLAQIDSLFEALKSKEGDVSKEGEELAARYNTLTNYINAKVLKEKLDENNLTSYAQSNYDAGVKNLSVVEDAYASNEAVSKDVISAADAAYSNFNTVYITAYKALAKAERKAALDAKKDADGVKAGVSRKEEYGNATKLFQEGDSLYSMQSPEKALGKYTSSKNAYVELAADVAEKRKAAQKAIEEAKKRVAESELIAERADAATPIEEPIEGIEEEDAVLLEEDNYENPDEAVIEVAQYLDGEDDIDEEIPAETEETKEPSVEESAVEESSGDSESETIEDELIEEELAEISSTAEETVEEEATETEAEVDVESTESENTDNAEAETESEEASVAETEVDTEETSETVESEESAESETEEMEE